MTMPRRRWEFLAWLLIIAAPFLPARAAGAGDAAVIKWTDCSHYHPLPQHPMRCGYAFVDGTAPATLPFAIIQSGPAEPSDSAVLFLQGGPGLSSGLDPIEFSWHSWAEWAQLPHDLIVFDQRGTGIASPASFCVEFPDVVRPALASGLYSPRSSEIVTAAKADCHEDFVASGYDLTQFTVRHLADDAAALMAALPYSDWTLLGSSYGTRVALEIMRSRPEGVRSAVLDGVVPPDVDMWLSEPALLDNTMAMIDRVCPVWRVERPECHRYAGSFLGSLDDVLDVIAQEPRWLSVDDWFGNEPYKVRIGPAELLYALIIATSVADGANYARDAVVDASHGDYRLLDEMLEFWAVGQTVLAINEATFFSVSCNFNGPRSGEELYGHIPRGGYFDRNIGAPSFGHPCENWTESRAPEVMRQPVASAIPTLLISGEYDSITPSSWGDRVAATLDRSYHFTVRRGGHGALLDDDCAIGIMRAFLADPNKEPDSQCLQDRMPGIRTPP